MNAKEPTHGSDGARPSVNLDQTTQAIHSHAPGIVSTIGTDLADAFRDARYRPRHLHAHGGLGEVYVADDTELGRAVALKRIRDGRGLHAEDELRFRREAEITGRLEHPGVVPIYGLGSDASGRPFYAMRFIDGQTLADAIDAFHRAEKPERDEGERALALRHLLTRFVAACQAVAFAHSRGIIHRDIKPANIMLGHSARRSSSIGASPRPPLRRAKPKPARFRETVNRIRWARRRGLLPMPQRELTAHGTVPQKPASFWALPPS